MSESPRREADVTATLACNNDCLFCPREVLKSVHVPSSALRSSLKTLRAGADSVVLTGGEVTIRADFMELVSGCRDLGFRSIGIVTNGRMFSRERFAQRALEAGLTDAAVSVYSHEPGTHDRITRVKGSCLQSWLGLARALSAESEGRRLRVRSNVVASSHNVGDLQETLRRLIGLGVRSLLVIDPVSEDGGGSLVDHARVREVYETLRQEPASQGVRVSFRGYPACVFGGDLGEAGRLSARFGDWHWEAFDAATTPGHGAARLRRYRRRIESRYRRVPACAGCLLNGSCPGFQADYLSRFGTGGLRGKA